MGLSQHGVVILIVLTLTIFGIAFPGAGGGFVGSAQAQYGDGGDDDPESPTETDNQSSESVTIEYGNNSTTISPFTGNKNITNVYGFDSISFSSDISLQKSDTARVFLYDGPNGLSLVTVLDSATESTGASATYVTTGLPADGEWIVKDDPEDEYENEIINWAWDDLPRTDGGVFNGGLDDEFNITIEPKFNEEANRDRGGTGEIIDWEFVSGEFQNETGEFRNVTSVDMKSGDNFKTVTIRSDDSDSDSSSDSDSGSGSGSETSPISRSLSTTEVAPNETVTLTTELTGASGSVSTSSSYEPQFSSATVQSVTVNGEATDPIISEATVNGSTVTLGDVGTDATVTITEELTVGEELNVTHTVTGDVTLGGKTTDFEAVSVTVADVDTEPESVVDEFDEDGNGDIEITELGQAGQAFASGELTITELGEVGAAFAS